MHAIYAYYQGMTWDHLLILGFIAGTIATAMGAFLDRLLQDRGFGIMGNGILLVAGVVCGIGLGLDHPIPLNIPSGVNMLVFSVTAPTLLLIVCAFLKARLMP